MKCSICAIQWSIMAPDVASIRGRSKEAEKAKFKDLLEAKAMLQAPLATSTEKLLNRFQPRSGAVDSRMQSLKRSKQAANVNLANSECVQCQTHFDTCNSRPEPHLCPHQSGNQIGVFFRRHRQHHPRFFMQSMEIGG